MTALNKIKEKTDYAFIFSCNSLKERILTPMDATKQRMIDFLLENANPSIKYRVKKEILNSITPDEEKELQNQILNEPIIQLIMKCQKENGWIGNGFHGPNKNAGLYENQEVGTKYLAEKGVLKDTPVLKRAMEAFVTTKLSDLCYRTKGKIIDEFKYAANGQNIIRCACIARAGYDDIIDISPQIQLSLDSFKRVLEVDSILDVSRTIKSSKYRIFNNYEKWPCRYHLDILAHTNSWKTTDNIRMLADSIEKLMRTDRPELIGVIACSWVGHVLGTVGCYSEGFSIAYEKDGVHYTELELVLWLCRCGLTPYIEKLQDEVDIIRKSVNEDGICEANVNIEQIKGCGTYSGLQLEVDWKSPIRKLCDITFRALQVLHYSECV